MDLPDPVTLALTLLWQHLPYRTYILNFFLAWFAASWLATQLLQRWKPPAPTQKFLATLHRLVAWLAGSKGFAETAYQVGRRAVFIPANQSRVEASIKLGYDPKTTAPRQKTIPKLLDPNSEKNPTSPQGDIEAAQAQIAAYSPLIKGADEAPAEKAEENASTKN